MKKNSCTPKIVFNAFQKDGSITPYPDISRCDFIQDDNKYFIVLQFVSGNKIRLSQDDFYEFSISYR